MGSENEQDDLRLLEAWAFRGWAEGEGATTEEGKIYNAICAYDRRVARVQARPFRARTLSPKLQKSRVWGIFKELLAFLRSWSIDRDGWLEAQFSEVGIWYSLAGSSVHEVPRYPYPAMLISKNAWARWLRSQRKSEKQYPGAAGSARYDQERCSSTLAALRANLEEGFQRYRRLGVIEPLKMLRLAPGVFPAVFWLVWPEVRVAAEALEVPARISKSYDVLRGEEGAYMLLDEYYRRVQENDGKG